MWKAATNTARPCASVWKGHLEYCNYSKSNLVEDHKQTIITAKSKCYLDRITIFFAKYLLPQRRVLIVIQHALPRIIEVQTD